MVPIVVITYNRPDSLSRLLDSLNNSYYFTDVTLIISIDGQAENSISIAENFNWQHGKKRIITQSKRLGLKDHILKCGDLALENDGVIVLEDDLYVARDFYNFALQALNYYNHQDNIAGISLYSHRFNETAQLPFTPLYEGKDVFFIQHPSSWGQCWSKSQWSEFRNWYNSGGMEKIPDDGTIPENVLLWPHSSWKKYFVKYMVTKDKYFVYPQDSFSTNFCEPGQHYMNKEYYLQVPLTFGGKKYDFTLPEDAIAIYDSFMEMSPESIKKQNSNLKDLEFVVDLYGTKNINRIDTPLVLTSKYCTEKIMNFGLELKPHEMNILDNIPGNHFSLARKEHCVNDPYLKRLELIHNAHTVDYYYGMRHFIKNPVQKIIPQTIRHNKYFFRFSSKIYFTIKRTLRLINK